MSPTLMVRFVSSLNSRFSASLRGSFSSTWPPGTCHLPLNGSTLRFRSRNLPSFVQTPSTHTTSFFRFKFFYPSALLLFSWVFLFRVVFSCLGLWLGSLFFV